MTEDIIGRESETKVIGAFLDRRVEGLTTLVLEGDPGIGKSTLWLAGVAAARERSFQVLTSRPAEAERTLAYVVLGDLFADVEPRVLAVLPAPRRRAFEAALLREEQEAPVDHRALGAAILSLLQVLSGEGPLVLAIDDDQWMDPASSTTLRFALRRLLRQPIRLLLSRRLDAAPATALDEAIERDEVERLRVGSLSMGAIQLLLRRRLRITFPRPTLLRVHEASGGNPFYALELGRARSADPVRDLTAPLAVPPSLERLVSARLDALGERTRRALLLIAAHGRMPSGLLRALDVAPEMLDEAYAAHVIEATDGVVSFTHPLLASALYQVAAGHIRHAAHRRLTTVLDDPVDRGRHLALGAEGPDDELAATLDLAVAAARDRGMPIAAAELAEHSLRLTPSDTPDHWHRRAMATARAHLEAGEASRARAIADDVLARAARGTRRAEALVLSSELADPASAVDLLGDALAQAAGVPELEASIHLALAEQGRMTKGRQWAEPHGEASLRLAEQLNDDALRASALMLLAGLRFDRGEPDALELAERAYGLATQLADPRHAKAAGVGMGFLLMFSGSFDRAREWLERQLIDWGDRDEQVRSALLWCLALVEVWSGRWALASAYADQVREIALEYGEAPTDHLSPALIALHRGQIDVARDHSKRALSLANGHLLPQHVAILGICDLWSGDATAGQTGLQEAEQTADARGWDDPNLRWWRAELVEALLKLGRIEEADRLQRDWEAAAARIGRARVLAAAVRCRGLIAAARGDLSGAESLLEQAVDRHGAVGDPFGRARAHLSLGVVRLRARQKRSARAALEAAGMEFEALGAAGWAAAARVEAARIGGRSRIEGLSPSEIRVAGLVADGLTNREIASSLFLGERTVASHLTHIYAKLGIRSRTELARRRLSYADSQVEGSSKVPTS
ncbi:MAG TPA: LuxR C-terminal-related transcriptional regulator [Casimicrobiaceae bacterium]